MNHLVQGRWLLAILVAVPTSTVLAGDVRYPADAGVINVKQPPYNAKGDGKTDDTRAIQKALDDHPNAGAIIYLPRGTYRISDTLRWPKGTIGGWEYKQTILEGESRQHSRIVLQDRCPGFRDPDKPKALVWTGPAPAQRFRNAVRNLSLDTGKDNPGAIGLQFNASNQGGVFDVTIRSGDGTGPIGLDMSYTGEIGPCLIRNVEVQGFAVGVRTGHVVNSITIESLTLSGQSRCGLENVGQVLNVRRLVSDNAVVAIVNARGPSFLTLIDARLIGRQGAENLPAIRNDAPLLARNVTATGYARVLDNAGKPHPGLTLNEFTSLPARSLFGSETRTLGLRIEEIPNVTVDDPRTWVSVRQFGAGGNDYNNRYRNDDTPGFQKAIDSGASTVYVPRGFYVLNDTVHIRGKVRRIVFLESQLVAGKGFKDSDKPVFRFEDGTAEVVVLERFSQTYGSLEKTWLEHASKRTLVIRSSIMGRYDSVGGGRLFLDDVCGGPFTFRKQEVWARQLNQETEGTHVVNDGGRLWILGYKTERGGTLLETRRGGSTEVLGCFAYATTGVSKDPMFVCQDAQFSVNMGEAHFGGNFPILVREIKAGTTRELHRKEAPSRFGIGALLPLYVTR
jgi:hypothetical protein